MPENVSIVESLPPQFHKGSSNSEDNIGNYNDTYSALQQPPNIPQCNGSLPDVLTHSASQNHLLLYRSPIRNPSRSTPRSSTIQDYESTAVNSESVEDLRSTQLSLANEEDPEGFSLENDLEDLRACVGNYRRQIRLPILPSGDDIIGSLGKLHGCTKPQLAFLAGKTLVREFHIYLFDYAIIYAQAAETRGWIRRLNRRSAPSYDASLKLELKFKGRIYLRHLLIANTIDDNEMSIIIKWDFKTSLNHKLIFQERRTFEEWKNRLLQLIQHVRGDPWAGTVYTVNQGELIPANGIVAKGSALVEEGASSGAIGVVKKEGETLRTGTKVLYGSLEMVADTTGNRSILPPPAIYRSFWLLR